MTAAPGSEDAGLVLSAEERESLIEAIQDGNEVQYVERIVAARVEAARAEERERIAAAIGWRSEAARALFRRDEARALREAARIARTPARAAGDDEGGDGCG